jgi:hypothetical protein
MTVGLFDLAADTPLVDPKVTAAPTTPGGSPTRVLSIAELQAALRIVTTGPAVAPPSSVDTAAPADSSGPAAVARAVDARNQRSTGSPLSQRTRCLAIRVLTLVGAADLLANLAARKARRTPSAGSTTSETLTATADVGERLPAAGDGTTEPWAVVGAPSVEPLRARVLRWLLPLTLVVLTTVGLLSVTGRVVQWFWTSPAVTPAVLVPELQFTGVAETVALEYLTWNTADRTGRADTATGWGLPAGAVDGWDGTGRLTADAAATIAVHRCDLTGAVATVRVRIHPAASGPRWVLLAVPLELTDGMVTVAATPALVGTPPDTCTTPALPQGSQDDVATRDATAGTVAKLVTAYGAGDLEFVRAPGTRFVGLGGAVTSGVLQSWRVAAPAPTPGADPASRVGDLAVVWAFPDGGGSLRCAYRVTIVNLDGRWLLSAVQPETRPLP